MIFFTESNQFTPTGLALYHTLSRTIISDNYVVDVKKNQTLDLTSTSTTSRPYSHRSGPLCPAYIRAYFSVLETFETQLG